MQIELATPLDSRQFERPLHLALEAAGVFEQAFDQWAGVARIGERFRLQPDAGEGGTQLVRDRREEGTERIRAPLVAQIETHQCDRQAREQYQQRSAFPGEHALCGLPLGVGGGAVEASDPLELDDAL